MKKGERTNNRKGSGTATFGRGKGGLPNKIYQTRADKRMGSVITAEKHQGSKANTTLWKVENRERAEKKRLNIRKLITLRFRILKEEIYSYDDFQKIASLYGARSLGNLIERYDVEDRYKGFVIAIDELLRKMR